MDSVEFTVQGSSATPYTVSFIYEENRLGAFCTCAAGNSGTACKHRLSILAGSGAGIVSGDLNQLPKVLAWLKGSEIEASLLELAAAEAALEKAKIQVSKAKKKLSSAMIK
jgi:hypothetical protein